jgi:3-phenylpropionate/cinnamic acid dioxygenase small subunit
MTLDFGPEDRIAITDLLHRYAYAVDGGDFDEVGRLFEHGTFYGMGDDRPQSGAEKAAAFKRNLILYEDGTPLTQHRISNILTIFDPESGRASSSCYVSVLQKLPDHALELIVAARYEDAFERVAGEWRFTERRTIRHFVGDISRHNRLAL